MAIERAGIVAIACLVVGSPGSPAGGDRQRGSVWTRLGDELIERQFYDAVVFVPVAVAGSTIAQWQPGGELHESILETIEGAQAHGLTITHMLWHQGESDAISKTTADAYKM